MVHVHGAALSSGAARLSAGQLGQHAHQTDAADVGPAVGAVGGDDGVLFAVAKKRQIES